jgi:hypothetical protein
MEPEQARELSERDQLWASLRALRPEIDALAAGRFDGTDRQTAVATILARVVAAELDYRTRAAAPDETAGL